MSGADVAALIAAIAVVILVIGLLFALFYLVTVARELRVTADELRRHTVPLVTDMRETVAAASAELERVDDLVATAESLSNTVDSASRLAYRLFSKPVIKTAALGAGTAQAARRVRRRTHR